MPAKPAPYVPIPYVGEPYRDSGNSRTLAQLMLARGDSQAAMHLQRGDAQARAFQQAGNVINNAVSGWQQNVEQNRQREIDAAREARTAEMSGMQMEATRLQLDEAKRLTKGRATARAVLPLAQREDGVYGYDRDVIAREMEAAGAGDMLPEIYKNLDDQEQSHRAVLSARRDAISDDALRLLRSGSADEDAFEALLEVWEKNDLAPKRDLALMRKAAKTHGIEQTLIGAAGSSERGAQTLMAMQKANQPELLAVNPGDVVIDKRNPQAGALFTAPAADPKAPTLGSFEDFVSRKYGPQATPDQIVEARKVYQQADDRPININTGAGQPRPLTQTAEAQIVNRLSSQWTTANKTATDLDNSIKLMDAGLDAARRGDLAAGSQAVLVSFQKILDPGSVVREAEFNRSAAGQSLLNRVQGAAEKLVKGGSGITLQQLETFAQLAREARAAQGSNLSRVRGRLGKTADRYNIPREIVFEDDGTPSAAPAADGDGWQVIDGIKIRVRP